jgi:pimeloyl-ACP methyl ester carboxylesterase
MAVYDALVEKWPVPHETIDLPGRFGCTHMLVSGPKSAPALVLLHGYLATLNMWASNIVELSRDYRVYALDIMGQPGRSLPDQPFLSQNDLLLWLSDVLDNLGIQRANLVGMSYGGWLTLNYAIHNPGRVNKIVLLSPAAGFLPLNRQHQFLAALMYFFPSRLTVRNFKLWETFKGNLNSPENLAFFNGRIEQIYLGLKHFRMQGQVAPHIFTDAELRSVKAPTLLLIGQQEAIYDPAASLERARRLIPNVETRLIPNASHDMAYFQAKAVDERILKFLAG